MVELVITAKFTPSKEEDDPLFGCLKCGAERFSVKAGCETNGRIRAAVLYCSSCGAFESIPLTDGCGADGKEDR